MEKRFLLNFAPATKRNRRQMLLIAKKVNRQDALKGIRTKGKSN